MAPGPTIIYQNQNFVVRVERLAPAREFWVTFSYAGSRSSVGNFFLLARDCSIVHVIAQKDEWYQHRDIQEAFAAIRTVIPSDAEISIFGPSMGGFAALAFASDLGAKRVLAIAPQVYLDQAAHGNFDNRWNETWINIIQANTAYRLDASEYIDEEVDYFVVFDPYYREDRRHILPLARFSNVHLISLPFSNHEVLKTVEELRLIDVIVEMMNRPVSPKKLAAVRSTYMERRRESSRYYHALGRYFSLKGEYASAGRLFRQAVERDSTFDQARRDLGAVASGLVAQAQERATKAVAELAAMAGRSVARAVELGDASVAAGRPDVAIAYYEKLCTDFPEVPDYRIHVANLHLRRSAQEAERAVVSFEGVSRSWPDRLDCRVTVGIASLLKRDFERAREVFQSVAEDAPGDPSVEGFRALIRDFVTGAEALSSLDLTPRASPPA